MTYYKHGDWAAKNLWRSNVARAMRRSAEARRCPKCGRGAAISRYRDDFGFWTEWCHYDTRGLCDYRREFKISGANQFDYCVLARPKAARRSTMPAPAGPG